MSQNTPPEVTDATSKSVPHESLFQRKQKPRSRPRKSQRSKSVFYQQQHQQIQHHPQQPQQEIFDEDEGSVALRQPPKKQPRVSTDTPRSEPRKEVLSCLVARSALVLPFKWSSPADADLSNWLTHTLSRTIVGPDGEKMQIWQIKQRLPYEVSDLDPHFRELIGAKSFFSDDHEFDFVEVLERKIPHYSYASIPNPPSDSEIDMDTDASVVDTEESASVDHDDPLDEYCQRLEIRPNVLEALFSGARLVANKPDESGSVPLTCPANWESVEMVVFPLGTAILMIHLNWLVDTSTNMTLDNLISWLHIAKYQYKSQIHQGWLFREERDESSEYPLPHLKSLGSKLVNAIYKNKAVTLSTIGNWLLCGPDEDPESPPNRVGRYLKRCYHHTCVVVDKEPSSGRLMEYLFHLRRAQGQENRPLPSPEQTSDTILIPRTNRHIGISRQGTACLSWPCSEGELDYEVNKWPTKFLGIYLILAMHVHGEKSVLLELSNLTADSGKLLKGITQSSYSKMSSFRLALISLASLMTRYALQMSSDDCGGLPEYVEFFAAMRNVFNIRQQREELRAEIQDVLALIETNYNEERRKVRKIEKQERIAAERRRRKLEMLNEEGRIRSERLITIVSSFTIPIVLVSGIFGMNNSDLPDVPFWPLMTVTLTVAIGFMVFFIFIYKRRAKLKDKHSLHEHDSPPTSSLHIQHMTERTPLRWGVNDPHYNTRESSEFTQTVHYSHPIPRRTRAQPSMPSTVGRAGATNIAV